MLGGGGFRGGEQVEEGVHFSWFVWVTRKLEKWRGVGTKRWKNELLENFLYPPDLYIPQMQVSRKDRQ